MTLTFEQLRAVNDNITARLRDAGIDTDGVRVLPPGAEVAADWPGETFASVNYPGWRVHIEAALTEPQRTAISAWIAALNATDYLQQVQDEVRATIAALPRWMLTETHEEHAARIEALPHATAAQMWNSVTTVLILQDQMIVAMRDYLMAQHRASQLRDDDV